MCLQAFADRDINLSKIESRPRPEAPWEYLFYIDVDGSLDAPEVQEALDRVRPLTNRLKVLGTYPRRAGDDIAPTPAVDAPAPAAIPTEKPAPAAACPATPRNPQLKNVNPRPDGARTTVNVGRASIGPESFTLIAGPCAVESRHQIFEAAAMVKDHGAVILRGGAFKPRSSVYAFQGLGHEGVQLLCEAGHAYELPVVTEVVRPEDVGEVALHADMLQIGARSMQNFGLLTRVGQTDRPVLLKRGLSATIDELLSAAEYIMAAGNHRVVLCERGIRTFETATRNTLDVSAVPVLKERTHLPVIVDPSHAAGRTELVLPLALAAAAVGADGLIVEAHPNPENALCDKDQALAPDDLARLVARLRPIVAARAETD
ncbi:MAG: 3-deoxy-7-phosphoheptulonate synthase [Planctomycetes bacterium]|nr:3-deoxy-7-phosphoheptulonate synthase [Planctomycetota bacterium]